jgi:UDP-N-acetylmuramate dehydrogenase
MVTIRPAISINRFFLLNDLLSMIKRFEDYPLKKHHTFRLDVNAKYFFDYSTTDDLLEMLGDPLLTKHNCLLLGGGSNLLFLGDYDGIVLHSSILGIEVVEEDEATVIVAVGAGVEWDALVDWSVTNNLGGIENLSWIPGDVGAAPVQNIGAYGVEFKDVFVKAEGVFIHNGHTFSIDKTACDFAYRDSIFKNELKNKVIITRVYLRLNKDPQFLLDYGNVRQAVEQLGAPTLKNVRQSIVAIRSEKLPDPNVYGNAGSFFKNPMVGVPVLEAVKAKYPDVPSYKIPDSALVKIPAGWLIEKAGWKGQSLGNAAVHQNQALVLINTGLATGREMVALAEAIEADIRQKFNITLQREVNVIG